MYNKKLNDIDFDYILKYLLKNKNKITEEQYNYFMEVYNKLKEHNPLVKDLLFVIFRKENYKMICSVFDLIYEKLILLLGLKTKYLYSSNVYELNL